MTTIDITVPRHIWMGPDQRYHKWLWETYGRYLQQGDQFKLKIRLGWR